MKHPKPTLPLSNFEEPITTSKQIALDLFLTIQGTGSKESIESVKEEIGFRRNNIFLNISKVSLSCRRLLDVTYFIVAQPDDNKELHEQRGTLEYSVDLSFFKWLMGYSSRNNANLKVYFNEAQRALISILKDTNDEKKVQEWASTQLLGESSVARGEITFSISNSLANLIKSPSQYHFLSLRFKFNSLYSRLLFDLLISYKNEGNTGWIPLEKLRQNLECDLPTYQEWKLLNNRVIKPAVAEINERSNLKVGVLSRKGKGSQRIGLIKFTIKEVGELKEPPMNQLKHLYVDLKKEFGLSDSQVSKLIQYNDSEDGIQRIKDAMEYTRFQVKNKGVIIKSPSSYLVTAVEKGLVVGSLEKFQKNLEVEDLPFLEDTEESLSKSEEELLKESIEKENALSRQGLGHLSFMSLSQNAEIFKGFQKDPESILRANSAGYDLTSIGVHETSSSEELAHLLGLYVSRLLKGSL